MYHRRILAITFLMFLAIVVPPATAAQPGGPSCVHSLHSVTSLNSQSSTDSILGTTGLSRNYQTNIVITFDNISARNTASFTNSSVLITGGYDIDFTPVLFAHASPDIIGQLKKRPSIESVFRNSRFRLDDGFKTQNLTLKSQERGQRVPWGIKRIGARAAARSVVDSAKANVTIAVLDTGIDYTHTDLDNTVVWGANFSQGTSQYGLKSSLDNNGHGTAVAGIIAAENNTHGIVGTAPGTQLYSIKVLDNQGIGQVSWLISGLDAAIKGPDGELGTSDDADVISISLGAKSGTPSFKTAIESASEHAIIVSAAGNTGDGDPTTNNITYPAKYATTIGVAATNRSNSTPVFSSEGKEIDLAAPGVLIETTTLGGGTAVFSGTSAAAPHVSGVAALLLAQDLSDGQRDLSNADIRSRLTKAALDIEATGHDREAGYGLIQADAALATDTTQPPRFTVSELSPQSVTVPRGDIASVSATITNTGDAPGTQSVRLRVDGRLIATQELTLRPGTHASVSFDLPTSGLTPAIHSYTISTSNESQTATLTVVAKPEANLTLNAPDKITPGRNITVQYVVTNIGNATGADPSLILSPGQNLSIVGPLQRSYTGKLTPGEKWRTNVKFYINSENPSLHTRLSATATLGDTQSSTTTTFRVVRTSVELQATNSTVVTPGSSTNITYTLYNTGITHPNAGAIEVVSVPHTITVDGRATVFLSGFSTPVPEPGSSVNHTFSLLVPSSTPLGNYTITAEGVLGTDALDIATMTLQVKSSSNSRFDRNKPRGKIDRQDVINAIDAFYRHEFIGGQPITRSDILEIINRYYTSSVP